MYTQDLNEYKKIGERKCNEYWLNVYINDFRDVQERIQKVLSI